MVRHLLLMTMLVVGWALPAKAQRGMEPDPFLQGEVQHAEAINEQPGPVQQAGWNAVDDSPGSQGRAAGQEPAKPPSSIYSAEENPSEVFEPSYLPRMPGAPGANPQYHSTDTHRGGVVNAGMLQSQEALDIPNPTPLEQPPPYTFLPDANPNQPNAAPQQLPPIAAVQSKLIATWLPTDDMGIFDLDLQTTVVAPTNPALSGWMMIPGFQVDFIDDSTSTDLPSQLYNGRVELGMLKQLNPQFGLLVAAGPGIWTDGKNTGADAWRVTGRAIGFFKLNPQAEFLAGVAYLDREDVVALPTLGVIYTPSTEYRFEMIFPQPKLAYRLSEITRAQGPLEERWVYMKGEFGGGSWATERASGADDIITYRDWRFIVGIESKVKAPVGLGWLLEAGYVFNREVEYTSGIGDFDPKSTALLRAGLTY